MWAGQEHQKEATVKFTLQHTATHCNTLQPGQEHQKDATVKIDIRLRF